MAKGQDFLVLIGVPKASHRSHVRKLQNDNSMGIPVAFDDFELTAADDILPAVLGDNVSYLSRVSVVKIFETVAVLVVAPARVTLVQPTQLAL